ncbi:MAG: acetyltransferase [Clostridia bacterium]
MNKKVVIIGASGHAKVIADIIDKSGDIVYGFLDDNIEEGTIIAGIQSFKVIGRVVECIEIVKNNPDVQFIIGIGDNKVRKKIAEKYKLPYYIAIHPSATIGLNVQISEGTVIMANSTINTSSFIGKHSIINTGSIIEHDNYIDNYVHISPNATLAGTVKIGELTHIGASTTVINNIEIIGNVIVGAGAVVIKSILASGTYVGVPVRKVKD